MEARAVAVMLVGLSKQENKEYWMQIVDDKHGSPDIYTARYADNQPEKFDKLDREDVEVVEYTKHSTETLPQFLLKTKFSETKSYDVLTHILCYLGEGAKIHLPSVEQLQKEMEIIQSNTPVIFLAPVNSNPESYKIILVNPKVIVLPEFNLIKELHSLGKKDYKGVMKFNFGSRKPIEHIPNEKHFPFENLGYRPDNNGNYQ